jgi:hypothetical protein
VQKLKQTTTMIVLANMCSGNNDLFNLSVYKPVNRFYNFGQRNAAARTTHRRNNAIGTTVVASLLYFEGETGSGKSFRNRWLLRSIPGNYRPTVCRKIAVIYPLIRVEYTGNLSFATVSHNPPYCPVLSESLGVKLYQTAGQAELRGGSFTLQRVDEASGF